jgi:hypothetical protein
LLSGVPLEAVGCSAYSILTITLDVRKTTVTVRCWAVEEAELGLSLRNASSPRSLSLRGWRSAGVSLAPAGAEAEAEEDAEEDADADADVEGVAEEVAVGVPVSDGVAEPEGAGRFAAVSSVA